MRKIVISLLVFVLVFSELSVSIAETIMGDPTESEIECEEQLESDGEGNLATECKEPESENGEEPTTEGEKQPESESDEAPTTEDKEQPETENGEAPTTEGEKESETENGEAPTTEEEEQRESGDEENLANACERQQEYETEENLVIEGEEQLETDNEENLAIDCEEEEEPKIEENLEVDCEEEFYIEGEELVAEEEEQLESNIEEEEQLESNIEEEKQLESNIEEELVTEGEEQEELASEKKSAPKCKRIASPRAGYNGIPITQVGKIGNIDFSMLDDSPNELDGFTQMSTNVGLELPTRESHQGRSYYMLFGDINNDRPRNSLKEMNSYYQYYDDWGRPLPSMNTKLSDFAYASDAHIMVQNFSVATVLSEDYNPDARNGVVTYYYPGGRPGRSGHQRGNGLVIAYGGQENDTAQKQSDVMPILKLYKNETTHELVAYAAVLDSSNPRYVEGYLKIKMSLTNERKGRIKVSMKYLNLTTQYPYTNIGYSAHMDIGGRHTDSRMYSLGNNKGLYFHEMNMRDGQDYYLYFFYNGYANNPAAMRATDNPQLRPFDSSGSAHKDLFFYELNAPSIPDPGKDVMYPYTYHPAWALRWEPQVQEPDTVREFNLEITVSNRPDVPVEVELDNDGEYTDEGYRITGTWNNQEKEADSVELYYKVDDGEPQKFAHEENPSVNTDESWGYTIPVDEVKKGLDHDISVYAVTVFLADDEKLQSNIETIKIRPELTIEERVFGVDGKVPTEVAPGETLKYEILVDSGYIPDDKGTYGQFTISQKYDPHLESPTDLKVTDENGKEIGTATYNVNEIVATLDTNPEVLRSTKVKFTFNAKVKEGVAEEDFVVSQATATGKYSTGDEVNQTSNEVKTKISGGLKFVSAPGVIGFGEKLKISSRTKTYQLIQFDESLSVKDSRALSRNPSWMMTAKLVKPLTGKKNEDSTLDGLYYRYGGNVSTLTEDASALVYKKKTTGTEEINISNEWTPEGDGLYLEVPAGTAKADAYDGTVQWILQNVPVNE
ncbi:hypothetical protein [Lysinibacillus xylanilyticus]|uniref:hypothetical protein n=1 Tax=Lysinibacillus xylanilyticus TaxID=582475 RepID=UPI00083C9469|nr:hypothetical protein [Lysinibacillus xylanilyticus]